MQELAARAHMLSLCAGNEIHDRRQLLVISDKFDDLAREAGAGVHTLQELSEELESIA